MASPCMTTSQRYSGFNSRRVGRSRLRRNILVDAEDGKLALDSDAVSAGGDGVENSSKTTSAHDLALSNEEQTEIHPGVHLQGCSSLQQTFLKVDDVQPAANFYHYPPSGTREVDSEDGEWVVVALPSVAKPLYSDMFKR